jgi:hypothetical protein
VFVLPIDFIGGTAGTSTSPGTGWVLKGSMSGGGVNKDVWYKVATGSESGNVATITIASATNSIASIELYHSTTGAISIGALVSGADTSSDLTYSATTGTATSDGNTTLVYMVGLAATSTRSSRVLTQGAALLGTIAAYFGAGTGITQEVGDRPVTVGVAATAVLNTYTLGTATTGITAVLILKEVEVGTSPATWQSSVNLTSSATSKVVDITGAATGDWVYMFVTTDTTQTAVTATGWTLRVEGDEGASTHYALFRRKKVGGDTTFTVSWPTSAKCVISLAAYTGLDGTTPDEGVVFLAHTTGATFATSSATPSAAGRIAAMFAYSRTSTSGNKVITWTPAAGLLERMDANNSAAAGSPWLGQEVADSGDAITVASHSYTATAAFAESHGGAILIYLIPGSTAIDLVVANVAQAQALSAPVLTQVHQLAAAGIAQAQVISAPVLTQLHVLAVASLAQAQALSTPAVTKQSTLVVAGLLQTPFIQAPIPLTQVHQLAVNGVNQVQVLSAPALTQVHQLVAAAIAQGQALSSPAVTVQSTLAPANLAQGQALSSPALTQVHALTVAGLAQAQSLAAVTLTQVHALAVAGVAQGQSLSSVLLAQVHQLAAAGLLQGQALQPVALSGAGSLAVAPISQAQALSAVALTQVHQIAAQSLQQVQTLSPVSLAGGSTLAPAGINQGQQISSPVLTQLHQLAVAGLGQAQQISSPAIGQVHILAVAGIAQAQTLTPVVLSTAAFLAVQGLTQGQGLSAAALTQAHLLAVQNLIQAQHLAGVAITAVHQLTVAGIGQVQRVSLVTLSEGDILYVYFWWDGQTKVPVKVRGLWTGSEMVEARVSIHNP